jgi:hypothetical protein
MEMIALTVVAALWVLAALVWGVHLGWSLAVSRFRASGG